VELYFFSMSTGSYNNTISRYFQPRQRRDGPKAGKRPRTSSDSSPNDPIEMTNRQQQITICDSSNTETKSISQLSSPQNNVRKKKARFDVEIINLYDNNDVGCEGVDTIVVESTAKTSDAATSPTAQGNNPFAKFAYSVNEADNAVSIFVPPKQRNKPNWMVFPTVDSNRPKNESSPKIFSATTLRGNPKKEGFVRMKDLSVEEQNKITRKWHSLADPDAPLEVRRYQVLLAARLHARCQEPTVRKAMTTLREAMPQGVTVETMADVNPALLATFISNLQFYNVKAQQVVKAAQEIKTRFGGHIPEDEWSLSQITGIGKHFADLLAFVNTRQKHETSLV
jgi:hypothetical protein